ncbi:hypothetical protein PVAP13_1KG119377 [Panicum virgatum]|uniref:Uncharacterized protein n=1 Tax=Panicum virgatum TaxID=38727 RepID=A0A8T0XCY2_PANVG|nr:hypothetical protein PVAP13_1KG119377 [Panicum virgatum]
MFCRRVAAGGVHCHCPATTGSKQARSARLTSSRKRRQAGSARAPLEKQAEPLPTTVTGLTRSFNIVSVWADSDPSTPYIGPRSAASASHGRRSSPRPVVVAGGAAPCPAAAAAGAGVSAGRCCWRRASDDA